MMYTCSICHKAYASRGALTRHEGNHATEKQLTCPQCDVVFRRKDLLARHVKIHQVADIGHRGRRRCHTACERCRQLRSKCDGAQTCSSCSSIGSKCVYLRKNGRKSERISGPRSDLHDDALLDESISALGNDVGDSQSWDGHVVRVDSARAEGNNSRDVTIAADADFSEHPGDLEVRDEAFDVMEENSGANFDLSIDSFWPYSTGWQWTHEDLYLQGHAERSLMDDAMAVELFDSTQRPSSLLDNNAGLDLFSDVAQTLQATTDAAQSIPHTSVSGAAGAQAPSLSTLTNIIDEMVASALSSKERAALQRSDGWHDLDARLVTFFTTFQERNNDHMWSLNDLVDRYFVHFHPLWPLVPNSALDREGWHPLLFFTLTSIGALYSRARMTVQYGSLMHARLRSVLTHHPFGTDQKETEALDLGRAMLLTQVAALYFEQEGAFSAAQQLGATLSSHAYRMRLFTLKKTGVQAQPQPLRERDMTIAEGRRMLAYGMLRAETFMSILFNRKPLLCYEEINLPLPLTGFSGSVIETSHLTNRSAGKHELLPCGGVIFSDLVRIALDEDEIVPLLKPTELELVLFGLQHDVWRFCHDPEVFIRLTKRTKAYGASRSGARYPATADTLSTESDNVDLLDHSPRRMRDLKCDHDRVITALSRWKDALSRSQLAYPTDHNRSAYLSGIILYHLSFLRLDAPIETILQIAYELNDISPADHANLKQVEYWASSEAATRAIKHAQSIWSVLHAETSRPSAEQAKYNILALIAIHHAATVVWAAVGTDKHHNTSFFGPRQGSPGPHDGFVFRRANTKTIMLQFADLYPKITASWGMQSSFHKIVKKLAENPLPTQPWTRLDGARMDTLNTIDS